MLPKPEKISKKKLSSESEELPKVVDPEIKIAALRKKRLMVGVGLGFTVFLSITFSAYRFFKTTKLSLPKISPPSLNLNLKQSNNNISSLLDKELSDDEKIWNLTIQDSTNDSLIKYSNSSTNFDYNFEKINQNLYQDNNKIKEYLPGGVVVKFYSFSKDNNYIAHLLMQNPLQDIQVSFAILNSQNLNEEQIIAKIGTLSQKIYWNLVSN